jgi:hypothetical protein
MPGDPTFQEAAAGRSWSDLLGFGELHTNVSVPPKYCPWCGSEVAEWGHDDGCPTRD